MTEASQPLVTVVMIFLNGEEFIAEAIDSVVAQTYANWELILVDDGSTDGGTRIARDYATRHPDRIRYIEHEGHANRGMSASRNAGVREGRGDYISFLDCDDLWLPERLTRYVEAIEAFPDAGMVYGPTLYWYSWAAERGVAPAVLGEPDWPSQLHVPTGVLIEPPVALRQFLVSEGSCLPCMNSLIIRPSAYQSVGGFEEVFRGFYEDQVFLSKMTYHHRVAVIDEVLDYYRQHSKSCCYVGMETGEYHPAVINPARGRYLEWLDGYLADAGADDPVIRRELKRQRRVYLFPIIAKARWATVVLEAKLVPVAQRLLPGPVYMWMALGRRRLREALNSLLRGLRRSRSA